MKKSTSLLVVHFNNTPQFMKGSKVCKYTEHKLKFRTYKKNNEIKGPNLFSEAKNDWKEQIKVL